MLTLCLPVAGIQEEAVAIEGRREDGGKKGGGIKQVNFTSRSVLFGHFTSCFTAMGHFPIIRDTSKCYMLLCSPIYVVGHRG
jgi:hypothetical protein